MKRIQKTRDFIIRNRFTIWDVGVFLLAAYVLTFLGAEYELLTAEGMRRSEVTELELGELFVICFILGSYLYVMVRRMRAQAREVKRRRAAERRARELASQDPLTGLPNRRKFDQTVARALAEPPGADRCHAIFLLDLNRFKFINDAFGHPVGDEVLCEVGTRLMDALRESGADVARLGGDEFGIIATHLLGPEAASGIALRVRDALNAPVVVGDVEHVVGVAIGIALFPRDGANAEELIRRADVALYRAKTDEVSSHHFFSKEMDAQIRERSYLEAELRAAIASGAIQPFYQPLADLKSNRITGFEMLPRWHHPKMGDVPPERFIPVAESCGLSVSLGEHLLRQACRDACGWPAETMLNVNVSPIQLRSKSFSLDVPAILSETGLPPQRLEIEITENTLAQDMPLVEETVAALRAAGVRIALDNFGTGYSSLYHLRSLKFDRIKIDRSFVAAMGSGQDSTRIMRALMGLGHGLGVEIAAEGIESREQRDMLLYEGCDYGQGFLYSKPLAAEDAAELLGEPASQQAAASAV